MQDNPAKSTAPRWAELSLIVLFLTFLWAPTLDTLLHLDRSTLPKENRLPAPFPEWQSGSRGLKNFLAGLNAYFNDHFGWRNRLIHWHRRLQLGLFPAENQASPGVIIGRDGWLFLNADGTTIDYYRGTRRFTPQDLRDWQALLEHRRDWLARLGIKYLFVVAPNKQSIYSEEVPDWWKRDRPDTKLDQLIAYMRAHSTVEVVDLRAALRDARQIAPTYFKTDSHWNPFGGFIGYQEIIKALAKQMPGLEPLPLSDFTIERPLRPSSYLADWADWDVNETCAVLLIPKPGLPPLEMSQPFLEYSDFIVGVTENPQARGTVAVFGDSFQNCLAPYLGYHFRTVTFHKQHALPEQWLAKERPDVVVSEMVEQEFDMTDPNTLDEPGDFLMRPHRQLLPTKPPGEAVDAR